MSQAEERTANWDAAVKTIQNLKAAEHEYDGEGRCSLLITFTATKLFDKLVASRSDPEQEDRFDWEVWGTATAKPVWKSGENDRLQVARDMNIVTGRAEVPVRVILDAIVASGNETGMPWTIEELLDKTTKEKIEEAEQTLPENYLDLALGEEGGGIDANRVQPLGAPDSVLRRVVVDQVRKDALYLHFTIKVKTGAEDIVLPIDMCIH